MGRTMSCNPSDSVTAEYIAIVPIRIIRLAHFPDLPGSSHQLLNLAHGSPSSRHPPFHPTCSAPAAAAVRAAYLPPPFLSALFYPSFLVRGTGWAPRGHAQGISYRKGSGPPCTDPNNSV